MDPLKLVVSDDESNGLPAVRVVAGSLPSTDLATISRYVHKNLEELIALGEGQVVPIKGMSAADHEPACFRVTFSRVAAGRYPRIHLEKTACRRPTASLPQAETAEPIPEPPAKTEAIPAWQSDLLTELSSLVQTSQQQQDGQRDGSLEAVLEDMRRAAEKNPAKFSLLLLMGYLHVGDEVCSAAAAPAPTIYRNAAPLVAQEFEIGLAQTLLRRFQQP